MDKENRTELAGRFNRTAQELTSRMTDTWVIGAACGLAAITAPFHTTAALLCLATPTIYQGIAIAYRLIGNALAPRAPGPTPD